MSRNQTLKDLALIAFSILFAAITTASCEKMERAKYSAGKIAADQKAAALPAEAPAARDGYEAAPSPASGGENAAQAEPEVIQRKLVVNVNLTIEVDDLKKSAGEAESIAKDYGGYVFESSISQAGENKSGQISLRVPAANLDKALARVEKIGRVEFESKASEDVTRQFIDTTARLNNLKKEEVALSNLLNRPGKLEEILQVENELSRVRTDIESMQGQLNFLEKEVAYSKINLSLLSKGEPERFRNWPLRDTVKRAARSFLYTGRNLGSAVIWIAFYLPYIILFYILYRILRRLLRRNKQAKKP